MLHLMMLWIIECLYIMLMLMEMVTEWLQEQHIQLLVNLVLVCKSYCHILGEVVMDDIIVRGEYLFQLCTSTYLKQDAQ